MAKKITSVERLIEYISKCGNISCLQSEFDINEMDINDIVSKLKEEGLTVSAAPSGEHKSNDEIPRHIALFRDGSAEGKTQAAGALWNLAFNSTNKSNILRDKRLIQTCYDEETDTAAKRNIQELLNKIRE